MASGASRMAFEGGRIGSRQAREVTFRFFPAGTGAPTYVAADNPWVSGITRTGVGVYQLTLRDSHKTLLKLDAQLQIASGTAVGVRFGVVSNLGTSSPVTAFITALDAAGAAVEIAANANNSISGSLLFSEGT